MLPPEFFKRRSRPFLLLELLSLKSNNVFNVLLLSVQARKNLAHFLPEQSVTPPSEVSMTVVSALLLEASLLSPVFVFGALVVPVVVCFLSALSDLDLLEDEPPPGPDRSTHNTQSSRSSSLTLIYLILTVSRDDLLGDLSKRRFLLELVLFAEVDPPKSLKNLRSSLVQ
jgi:hypothetical protein